MAKKLAREVQADNAQARRKHNTIKIRVPKAFWTIPLLVTGAIIISGCAGSRHEQKTNEGGDSVLVLQADSAFAGHGSLIRRDTTTIPDVRSLEHYNPFSTLGLNDALFMNKDPKINLFKRIWIGMEDGASPFGLSKKAIDSYSQEDRAELMGRWEIAKKELKVAFLSDKGATPSNALAVHTPEEVKEMMRVWDIEKESLKKSSEFMQTWPPKPHGK